MFKKSIFVIIAAVVLFLSIPAEAAPHHPGLRVTVSRNRGKYTARVYHNGMIAGRFTFTRKPKIIYINSDRLTWQKLTRRKNRVLYIEVMTGTVINKEKDGRLDTAPPYNYISYRGLYWTKPGSRVRTYCIYNPSNNYEDDISIRLDHGI